MIITNSAFFNVSLEKFEEVESEFPNLSLKRKFLIRRIFVLLLSSFDDVCRYSQDLIAKKMAPMSSQDIAMSRSVDARLIIFRKTESGKARCFLDGLSTFLYPRCCS